MPFQIQGDAKIIRIVLSGHLTVAEIGDLGRELMRMEAGFQITPDRLTDLSAVDTGHFSYETLEDMATESRKRVYKNKIRSAIVAPNPLDYGLSRLYQTLSEHPQICLQIFRTRAEAEAWLAGG